MKKISILLFLVFSAFGLNQIKDSTEITKSLQVDQRLYVVTKPAATNPKYSAVFDSASNLLKTYPIDSIQSDSVTHAVYADTADIALNTPDSVRACYKADSLVGVLGKNWTLRANNAADPGKGGTNLQSICYGNDLFVATSSQDEIIVSSDGIRWVDAIFPEDGSLSGICYGAGMFVAVKISGTYNVITSNDGLTWTSRQHYTPTGKQMVGVEYGGGTFIAIASDSVFISNDGITWNKKNAKAGNWVAATFGNGIWVAVGASTGTNKAMYSSTGGNTWSVATAPTGANFTSIAYGQGKFVAIEYHSDTVQYIDTSISGWVFTRVDTVASSLNFKGLCYGDGIFAACGITPGLPDSTHTITTSPDGVNWTVQTTPAAMGSGIPGPYASDWHDIVWGNGTFVAVAGYQAIDAKSIMTSGKMASEPPYTSGELSLRKVMVDDTIYYRKPQLITTDTILGARGDGLVGRVSALSLVVDSAAVAGAADTAYNTPDSVGEADTANYSRKAYHGVTAGYLPYSTTTSTYGTSNTYYDAVNGRIGIGTGVSPVASLDVKVSGIIPALKISGTSYYDGGNYGGSGVSIFNFYDATGNKQFCYIDNDNTTSITKPGFKVAMGGSAIYFNSYYPGNGNTAPMYLNNNYFSDGVYRHIFTGKIGIGITPPTALLHIKAGTSAATTGPLKFTQSGAVLLATPELGLMEVDSVDGLYYTIKTGSARRTIAYTQHITDSLNQVIDSLKTLAIMVGSTGTVFTNVTMFDGDNSTTHDTLFMSAGGKIWAFQPLADK
jgi:hypothetical protein